MRAVFPGLACLLLASTGAFADRAAADACAASLKSEARSIYDAMAPLMNTTTDTRQPSTSTSTQLETTVKLAQGTSRESAQAAGACLEKLR